MNVMSERSKQHMSPAPTDTPTELKSETTTVNMKSGNATMERESSNVKLYSSIFMFVNVWQHITNYGMKYYNGGTYPLPQTQIVAITEVLKLIIFILVCLWQGSLMSIKMTAWFAVPSVIYAINNNIYLLGLTYTTPPVWNILIQLRIIFTALTYRILFHKAITAVQWTGVFVLVGAIVMTNYDSGGFSIDSKNLSMAIFLATIGSILSVIGTITMEYLFKNNVNSFSQMQVQLYLFGSIGCLGLYVMELNTTKVASHYDGPPVLVTILLVASILMTILSGVVVAFIVKKLDNMVKLYSQALANMVTSVACAIFYPDTFSLDLMFVTCLGVMFIGIYLYETKNLTFASIKQIFSSIFISSDQSVKVQS